jgi:hypothetical protein
MLIKLKKKLNGCLLNDHIDCCEAKCALTHEIDTNKQVFLDTITPPF